MDLRGVNGYGNIWSDYSTPSIRELKPKEIDGQLSDTLQIHGANESSGGILSKNSEETPITRDPNVDLEDISLTFNKQDDFSYIGKDSDIHSLDMEKAISDARKDNVLRQYQYFVGSAQNIFTDISDGIVFKKF